jgi:hypothetical protein
MTLEKTRVFFMSEFSTQLIQRMKNHFVDKYKVSLTDEQAEEYLNSWADLYLLVVGQAEGTAAPRGATATGCPRLH